MGWVEFFFKINNLPTPIIRNWKVVKNTFYHNGFFEIHMDKDNRQTSEMFDVTNFWEEEYAYINVSKD